MKLIESSAGRFTFVIRQDAPKLPLSATEKAILLQTTAYRKDLITEIK
jgi:hypothetical protein